MPTSRTALVTGATGYIGGQLIPALLDKGWHVRVLSRSGVEEAPWRDRVSVVMGDAGEPADLRRALDSVDVAYYLLHSMDGAGDFVARDRELARRFAAAALASGIRRIVYLSGLHPAGELSAHLASRVEVGEILLASGVPTAVLQAGVVLGDGSASYDMLRHLTERLPAVVAPKWLRNRIQPIAIADAVHYLVGAADLPSEVNRTFDIGGPDILTYAEMMRRYAVVAGLGRRFIATVPVLTPGLASHWVGVVTPVSAGVARPLVGSLVHDVVCTEDDIVALVGEPPGGRTGFDDAIRTTLTTVDPTRWGRALRRSAVMCGATALVGSLLTTPDSAWYRSLDKPPWQPPALAFPVVWTALYSTIAVASAATTQELEESGRGGAATAYTKALAVNLVLNAGWSGLFFRLRRLGVATAGASALAVSSGDLARRASAAGTGKGVALGTYAGWCAFATALTGEVWRRNRGRRRCVSRCVSR